MKKAKVSEETHLKRAIREVLTARGCLVVNIQSGILEVTKGGKKRFVHCAKKGTPDLLIYCPELRVLGYTWLEVKTKTGKLSPEQARWLEWAEQNGVSSHVVRSVSAAVAAVFKG